MIKKNIESIRPLLNIENDIMISRIGSYSIAFELDLKPIFGFTENDYEKCADEFSRILNILPDNTILHKMDIYYKNYYKKNENRGKGIKALDDAYNDKFDGWEYIEHKSYIFISKTSEKNLNKISIGSLIFKNDFIAKEFISDAIREEFLKSVSQAETLFNDSNYFKVKRLKEDEIVNLCSSYENLSFDSKLKFSSDIYQDKTKTKIGNKNISTIALNSLNAFPLEYEDVYVDPSYSTNKSSLKFSLFHPIGLGFKDNHIVNQVFIKEPIELVKKNLNTFTKSNALFSKESENIENNEDVSGFKNDMNKGFTPIKYHANVMLWDKSLKKLDEKENLIISAFNKIRLSPNITYGEILPLYWSCYPGNIADLGIMEQSFYLLDRQATALNIYESNSKSSDSGFGVMLSDRITGAPVLVDISDDPIKKGLTNNRNKMIFGPSGSGKSFFTNVMANDYLRSGAHMVIVDVGDSYERLCQLYNGIYLRYTESDPISFNPFNAPKEERNIEKKESLITLLFTLWKKNPDQNTRDEYKILSDSITNYYNNCEAKNILLSFNTYFEFMKEVFVISLKKENLSDHFDHKSFFNVLSMFYKGGEYDYLLNSTENNNLLHEQLIVFELDNIKGHEILFPVVTLMIMETFITKMRLLKNTRKVILIEEAWKAITKEGMAEFMKYLYKTVRKHFGEAILVTQEVDDIIGNPIIKDTILKNCGAKILLDMREYAENFEPIATMLGLNKNASELVMSLNQNNIIGEIYKEVFLGLGNEGNVFGVNVSKVEYACYTTEKTEKEAIESLFETNNNMEQSLIEYSKTI